MTTLETVAWILGTDVGLVSIATVFASAWIRVTRIDKLEDSVKEVRDKFSRIDVLETQIEAIESGIIEIKELIKDIKHNV